MFDNFWVANVVGGTPRRNRHHVQLRVGALSQIDGGGAGQLRVPGAVGGQQDLGREDAHLLASFSFAVRRCDTPHRAATTHSVIRSHQAALGRPVLRYPKSGRRDPSPVCGLYQTSLTRTTSTLFFHLPRVYVFRRREGRGLGPPPDRLTTVAPAWGFAPRTAHMPPRAAHSTWPR